MTLVHVIVAALRLPGRTAAYAGVGALLAFQPCFATDGGKGRDPASESPGELRPWLAGERRLPDRISHLHDPALKKVAEDARSSLSSAVDDQNGFDAELLRRLASKTKISESLLDLRSRILEEDFATGIGANSWASLASNYYADVGLDLSDLAANIDLHDIRLASRLSLLGSAANAYRALVLGQKILATERKGGLTNVTANLANVISKSGQEPSPASNGAITNSAPSPTNVATDSAKGGSVDGQKEIQTSNVETVLAFVRAFEQAGKVVRSNILSARSVSVQANDLHEKAKALYREIDSSNDGIALSLVVPIVGAGLDEASLMVLTNHVVQLRSRVLSVYAERFCSNDVEEAESADMRDFREACYEVIRPILDPTITNVCQAVEAARFPTMAVLSEGGPVRTSIYHSELEVLEFNSFNGEVSREGYRSSTNAVRASEAGAPVLAADLSTLGLTQATIRTAKLDVARSPLSFAAREIAYPSAFSAAATNLPALIGWIEDISGALDNLAADLSHDLNAALRTGADVLSSLGKTNDAAVAQAVTNILFNTQFWSVLETNLLASRLIDTNKIGTNFQFIVEGVGDIVAEARAEQARLVSVVLEFAANRTRMQQENLRHLQALGAVVSKEIRRWNGLFLIHKRYRDAFGDGPNLGIGPIPKSDPVLLTMRTLAKNARARHWEEQPYHAPQQGDGMRLLEAHRSLAAAVGLIQGYFLMDVFNRRYGGENSLLLDREIEEHSLHLASIRNKITHSMIRLAVEDQLAFHSTGWTKEDFANIMRALQTIGLGWVAEGN